MNYNDNGLNFDLSDSNFDIEDIMGKSIEEAADIAGLAHYPFFEFFISHFNPHVMINVKFNNSDQPDDTDDYDPENEEGEEVVSQEITLTTYHFDDDNFTEMLTNKAKICIAGYYASEFDAKVRGSYKYSLKLSFATITRVINDILASKNIINFSAISNAIFETNGQNVEEVENEINNSIHAYFSDRKKRDAVYAEIFDRLLILARGY